MKEKILIENKDRYVIYPIKHPDIWDFYKTAQAAFWIAESVDLSKDLEDWEKLNDNEKFFVKNVISFFAASDGIVAENLDLNFIEEITYKEVKTCLRFQAMMEDIHGEMYSRLIETLIHDADEKDRLFNAIVDIPCIKQKAEWAKKING